MFSLDFVDTAIIEIIATASIITAIVPNFGTTLNNNTLPVVPKMVYSHLSRVWLNLI